MDYLKSIKIKLLKYTLVKQILLYFRVILNSSLNIYYKIALLKKFKNDFNKYKNININKNFILSKDFLKPCLFDKTKNTPIDYTYFYQDTWCAKIIFENKPQHHYDIGSHLEMVGIISQFIPTTFIDIRSLELILNGLVFIKADILSLPFKDSSIKSLSSICVIEHIGLGRYSDKLDPFGSEKAINELKRVLAEDGDLYISVPVDKENIIYFNAHRAFTRDYILDLFNPLILIEEKYIYKTEMSDRYDESRGFGTGLFHFKK